MQGEHSILLCTRLTHPACKVYTNNRPIVYVHQRIAPDLRAESLRVVAGIGLAGVITQPLLGEPLCSATARLLSCTRTIVNTLAVGGQLNVKRKLRVQSAE